MASSDSDDEFDRIIQNAVAEPNDFNESRSDISISYVYIADSTDFDTVDGVYDRIPSTGMTLGPEFSRDQHPINIPEFDAYSGPPLPQNHVQTPLDFFS